LKHLLVLSKNKKYSRTTGTTAGLMTKNNPHINQNVMPSEHDLIIKSNGTQ